MLRNARGQGVQSAVLNKMTSTAQFDLNDGCELEISETKVFQERPCLDHSYTNDSASHFGSMRVLLISRRGSMYACNGGELNLDFGYYRGGENEQNREWP